MVEGGRPHSPQHLSPISRLLHLRVAAFVPVKRLPLKASSKRNSLPCLCVYKQRPQDHLTRGKRRAKQLAKPHESLHIMHDNHTLVRASTASTFSWRLRRYWIMNGIT